MVIFGPIALDALPAIPWKNGGGITRTIAVEPANAGMDNFLWRISIADLHASGSFSSFPGVDRTILLWSGAGFTLRSQSWPDQALTTGAPFAFSGDADVHCELSSGPSQDLNLMQRRGAVDAALKVSSSTVHLHADIDDLVILCSEGSLRIACGNALDTTLNAGYFLRLSQAHAEVSLIPTQEETRFAYASIRIL